MAKKKNKPKKGFVKKLFSLRKVNAKKKVKTAKAPKKIKKVAVPKSVKRPKVAKKVKKPIAKKKVKVKVVKKPIIKKSRKDEPFEVGFEEVEIRCPSCGRKFRVVKSAKFDTEGMLCQRCASGVGRLGFDEDFD